MFQHSLRRLVLFNRYSSSSDFFKLFLVRIFAQCQSDTLRVVSTTFIPFQRQLFFRRVQTFRGRENPVKVVETIGNFCKDFGNHYYFAYWCVFRNQSPRAGPAAAAVNTTDCRFEYWLFSFRIKVVVGRFASGFLFFFYLLGIVSWCANVSFNFEQFSEQWAIFII